jgi:1,2-diacylglycerol 3-alpha-glucosyltransferase
LRILMISDVYFPRINGVSTSIKTFKDELEAMGNKVTLIAPAYHQDQSRDPTIIRIPSRYLPLDPEDRLMRSHKIHNLVDELSSSQYDILHIHTPFIAHYAGVSLAKKLNIPCVETYHTYFEEYLFHYIPFLPKAWLKYAARRFTRTQCNDLNAVIVPSTAMHEVLRNYGVNTPVEVIPTGIELDKFKHANGVSFRKKHNIPVDRPTLTFIGRVAFEKNIDFLLKVVNKVRHHIPEVLLLIAGEGPALPHLKKYTRQLKLINNIQFLGYLDRNKALLDCYACADAFVFASRTETQGLVLLEAMALGVPLISTAVMGTKDILVPGRGALVAEESVDDFASKVIQLLSDKTLRTDLSSQALEYVKNWSAAAMALKLLHFYEKAIDKSITHAA